MLEVDRLCVDVGGRRLLDEVSFRLEEGRIYALIGANGSGKTSLIRALTSYYPRYGGSIRFDGKELRDCRRKERESLHALLPQVLPQLDSTLDTMLSEGSPILGQLGLEKLALRRISSLSGGERELSFLAMMLSREARLYCLDEAEANLDARCRRLVENTRRGPPPGASSSQEMVPPSLPAASLSASSASAEGASPQPRASLSSSSSKWRAKIRAKSEDRQARPFRFTATLCPRLLRWSATRPSTSLRAWWP